jgi:8-oxo-dGTP diphosphatase
MADRSSKGRRAGAFSVDVQLALFTPDDGALGVLLHVAPDEPTRSRFTIPCAALPANHSLDQAATDLAQQVAVAMPAVIEQVRAFGGPRQVGTTGSRLTVLYFGLLPTGAAFRAGHAWVEISEAPALLGPRQREEIDAALGALRARVDHQPIAFRLLPPTFTLSELQRVYELLLGRRLHKASFRRALHAASLVEATDEWRSEGRGRPAQLFRYAPPRRRRARRGVRFDALA